MLQAVKRTALDGVVWWVAYDTSKHNYSTDLRVSKYHTRKACEYAISKIKQEDN